MNRTMRRFRQQLDGRACEQVLKRCTSGVLALHGVDGYPYAVPLSYVYTEGKVVFHCAKEGYKLDCIRQDARASFCVIDQDEVVPEDYTTHYRSVMAFGRVHVVQGREEIRTLAMALGAKYSPDVMDTLEQVVEEAMDQLCILVMDVECITGKKARELVKQQEDQA